MILLVFVPRDSKHQCQGHLLHLPLTPPSRILQKTSRLLRSTVGRTNKSKARSQPPAAVFPTCIHSSFPHYSLCVFNKKRKKCMRLAPGWLTHSLLTAGTHARTHFEPSTSLSLSSTHEHRPHRNNKCGEEPLPLEKQTPSLHRSTIDRYYFYIHIPIYIPYSRLLLGY